MGTAGAVDKRIQKRLRENPEHFIKSLITQFVCASPLNRLAAFDNTPIFDKPLIGFADGNDPIFLQYKKVIGETHFTPRELLTRHVTEILKVESPVITNVSVISFILPIARETSRSNARETAGPSLRWNHTRWKGQEFINELSKHLVAWLESDGYYALAPELSSFYKITRLPDGFVSNWSQRHAAYAAGLGTFSLNQGFITKKGIAHRCGSVVTNLKLEPTPRIYVNHLSNCRFYAKGTCGKCIRRCPGGALSEKGHDKLKCFEVLDKLQKPWLEGVYGPGYIGRYAGCGLCQTGVPCEHRIPVSRKKRPAVQNGK